MLDIGTKVSVKNLHKEDRPGVQQGLRFIEREYGYIVDCADNGYYLVTHEDDMTYHEDVVKEHAVYIHEDELVNMDTYRPRFKIGDKVKICEPTEHDKKILYSRLDVRYESSYRESCHYRIAQRSPELL